MRILDPCLLSLSLAIAALVAIPTSSARAADLRTEVAKQLNARGSDFVLNFPPRSGCLPGSIFTDDLRVPLERTGREDIARKWMEIVSDDEGVAFYEKHQGALRDEMARTSLDFGYNSASGTALHVRFAGAAHGFRQEAREEGRLFTHEIKLLCQELDPERPHYFLAHTLGFVRTQDRIFAALPSAFPEVRDDTWTAESAPAFTQLVDGLGQRFVERFPADAARWKQLFQPATS